MKSMVGPSVASTVRQFFNSLHASWTEKDLLFETFADL